MKEFLQGMVSLIPGVIISIITAYVTVQLSMKQFYFQKWWEKKAEAYSHIIEQLSYLQYCFGEWFNDGVYIRELDDRDKEKLLEGYKQAKESITKATAIAAYIVSDNTVTTLEKLLRDLEIAEEKTDFVGTMDRQYGLIKECITKVKGYARIDLHK